MRRNAWYWAGAGLGWANVIRHRLQGYRTPRTFGADDTIRSSEYVVKVVDRWIERSGIEIKGKDVLELGPGPDLGTGYVVLARGAASYTAVDRFRLAERPWLDDPLIRRLKSAVGDADVARISYLVDEFPELSAVHGRYDLVLSNAVLEHVDDIPAVFSRLSSLLREGGEMCHHVDPRTHTRWLRERDPWNILRFEPTVYRTMLFPGMLNRLLLSDYVRAAKDTGFQVLTVAPGTTVSDEQIASLRKQLPTEFRQRPDGDLRMASFTIRCRRLAAGV